MAKKQAVRPIAPEEESQDVPDADSAPVIEEEDEAPAANGLAGYSKTDLIREAVQAGYEKPARGVAYIRETHGVEIDSKYYSIVKGKLGKAGEHPAGAPTAPPHRSAAPAPSSGPASGGPVPSGLFDDLMQLREIKDRYGDNFQKMVDAIG